MTGAQVGVREVRGEVGEAGSLKTNVKSLDFECDVF